MFLLASSEVSRDNEYPEDGTRGLHESCWRSPRVPYIRSKMMIGICPHERTHVKRLVGGLHQNLSFEHGGTEILVLRYLGFGAGAHLFFVKTLFYRPLLGRRLLHVIGMCRLL